MTHQDKIQLIQKLKSKPKQGIFDLAAKATQAATEFNASLRALDDTNVQVLTGTDKLIGANEVLLNDYKQLTAATLKFADRNKELNAAFGISTKSAAKLSQEFHKVASELSISGKLMMSYGSNIKQIIPTLDQTNVRNKTYYKGLTAVQRVLTTNLKLSAQQAEEYTYFATQQGENAASTLLATQAVTDALDPSGTMGYFKMATAGIAKAGAAIQLQYGKLPGNLELAVLKAHSLGLEVADLQKASSNLLNIESSIGDELEYQLLSGHRLTDASGKSLTNAYRMAAIQGDANKQADLMNRILDQEGETLSNNLFARQQMAKLMGVEEGQLARALQKKKLLKESGAEVLFEFSGKELQQQAKAMMDSGRITEDAFKKIMQMEDTRTTEEILEETLQVNQETALTDMLQLKQLQLIAGAQGAVLKNAGDLKLMKFVDSEMQTLGKTLLALRVPTIADQASRMGENAGGEDFYKSITEKEDALIVNDGLIKFNPRDQFMNVNDGAMIAGTNVDGNKKLAASINGANSAMTNAQISQLIQAFAAVGELMTRAIETQTNTLKRNNLFGPGLNGATWE